MEFQYDGLKVFYTIQGEGSPVILLHGWGCTHEVFAPVAELLGAKYSVYSLDLPGFGESDEPGSVWGVGDYTRMLEAFCGELRLESPSLVAHSFGGRISILFASRNRVDRMVLTDAAGIKPVRRLSYYVRVYAYKALKVILSRLLKREDLLRRIAGGAGSEDYRNASPLMKAVLSRTVNEDLTDRLPLIQAPTLLYWGTEDTATPLADARKMEMLIPDAGLVTVEGAGHFSFVEDPARYAAVLSSFFGLV